jgi:hypothetical protein
VAQLQLQQDELLVQREGGGLRVQHGGAGGQQVAQLQLQQDGGGEGLRV